MQYLQGADPALYNLIEKEVERQEEGIELIPSENYVSRAVLEALGTPLTNKYSEGYPGRRYYGGNEHIDEIEELAQERAKALFGVPHANVQPYSGSPANLAALLALADPGDTIMGQDLSAGGHLTHGARVSVTGRLFNSVPYPVNEHGYIDFDRLRQLAHEHRPRVIIAGITAYPREVDFARFAEIAEEVGAYLLADISHIAGLVVGGVHQSPAPHADVVTTTSHKTLRGPRGALIMVTEKGQANDPDLAGRIDKMVFPGLQGGPHDHQTAAIALALKEALDSSFGKYAQQITANARALARSLARKDIDLVTGGTDNHMLLADFSDNPGFGVFAQEALDRAGMTLNKNALPAEPSSPFYPSGARLGTPAATTRGMRENEMEQLAELIATVLEEVRDYRLPEDKTERNAYLHQFRKNMAENDTIMEVRERVRTLCRTFSPYR